MGWAAGSELGQDIYNKIRDYIPEEDRKEVASFIYDAVCDLDADDWDGSSQLEIDAGVPSYCRNCEEDFPADELSENYLCNVCEKEL
jgi:hypothetical protein